MEWNDFSEFFEKHRDFFSTLDKFQSEDDRCLLRFHYFPVVYLFLSIPLKKRGNVETDIVYIGETEHLWKRLSQYWQCWKEKEKVKDWYDRRYDVKRVVWMEKREKEGYKTRISLLRCRNKKIAKDLEKLLLNAFLKEYGYYPPQNNEKPQGEGKGTKDSVVKRMRDYRATDDLK